MSNPITAAKAVTGIAAATLLAGGSSVAAMAATNPTALGKAVSGAATRVGDAAQEGLHLRHHHKPHHHKPGPRPSPTPPGHPAAHPSPQPPAHATVGTVHRPGPIPPAAPKSAPSPVVATGGTAPRV